MKHSFVVNDHFEDFIFNWDCKFYFLVGGYGSSKSYHVATKILLKLMQNIVGKLQLIWKTQKF